MQTPFAGPGFHIETPFAHVYKTFQASVYEMMSSWLPDLETGSLNPITELPQLKYLNQFNDHFKDKARKSMRHWPGMES
jgi:hypothetical protein